MYEYMVYTLYFIYDIYKNVKSAFFSDSNYGWYLLLPLDFLELS